jgi:acyl carrier protein
MTITNDRLAYCYARIFPNATPEEIRSANIDDMTGWDSLRGVTFMAIIEEEFGVQLDPQDLLALRTYDALLLYLSKKGVDL